jgi:protocatechuate 3,4-dioxygenase beta subunit
MVPPRKSPAHGLGLGTRPTPASRAKAPAAALALAAGLALLAWWTWPGSRREARQEEAGVAATAAPAVPPPTTVEAPGATDSGPDAAPHGTLWRVTGRACSCTGDALPGTTVHAELALGGDPEARPVASAELPTTPDGAFEWSLEAPQSAATLRLVARAPRCVGAPLAVALPPGEPAPRDLCVAIEALDYAAKGCVLDADGEPLAGARVVLAASPFALAAVCDAEGRYSLALPSALGPLRLHAFAERHSPGVQDVQPAPRREVPADFRLFPEAVLRGRVWDREGRPVAGALLRALGTVRVETRSDAAGAYALTQLEADAERPFRIRVSARGHIAQELEVAGGATERDFTLDAGLPLRGFVVDELGAPVAGATVSLVGHPQVTGSTTAVSGADGGFALDAVPRGSFTLLVERRGQAPRLVSASADGGEAIRIRLDRGGEVSGSVCDRGGAPLAGVRLAFASLLADGPRYAITAVSNTSGAFAVEGIPREGARVELVKPGFEPAADVVAGSGSGYRFVLQRFGVLSGRVLDAAGGAPIPRFRVRVHGSELGPASPLEAARADAPGTAASWELAVESPDGRFATRPEQHRLRAGALVDVEASAEGYAAARLDRVPVTEVVDDERCVLRLTRGSIVRGRVVFDADDAPLRDASVTLVQEGRTDLVAVTGRAGEFELTGVPSGPTTLRVGHPRWPEKADGPFEVGEPGGVVERVIRIVVGETLEGTVLDQDGVPVPGAEIRLQPVEGPRVIRTRRGRFVVPQYGTPLTATADAQGKYRMTRLVPGKYVLEHLETHGTLRLTRHQVALDLPRGVTRRDLDPRAGTATLRVRVTRSGVAMELDTMTVVEASEPVGGQPSRAWGAWTVKGSGEVRGLAPTSYRVTYRGTATTVTLREGSVTEVALDAR